MQHVVGVLIQQAEIACQVKDRIPVAGVPCQPIGPDEKLLRDIQVPGPNRRARGNVGLSDPVNTQYLVIQMSPDRVPVLADGLEAGTVSLPGQVLGRFLI